MDIRITGTANLSQMRSQFAAMQAEVAALNKELANTSLIPGRVNVSGYQAMQRQVARSSEIWRAAAASTDQFVTQQLRLNTATEQYTELLKKQKLSFNDLRKNRNVLKQAYRDQIALQNMVVRENPMLSAGGKTMYDVAIPKHLSQELNTARNQLGWFSAELASGSRQLVNWGKNTQWAGRQLMVGFTVPVAAFGAATGALAYNIDKQLTRIKKVYDTTAQAVQGDSKSMEAVNKELAQVSDAAMKTAMNAAKEYGAAATDTLNVQAELAATGLKGQKLQDATTESMRLATLGELDYQQAASTTIALQTAFKLNTEQLTKAFNFMNATENATSLSIQDIAEATPRAASAMSALGVSVEQMTVLLTSMKEAGVDAAEGANALKSATGSILAPSPAVDKFIQQISKGKVQVMQLAEASGGNLYFALEKLYQEMEGLSDLQKQQILVKLFGKYQFNRVSAMVTNLGDAFNGTQNQTHKAMELMAVDSEKLAQTAEQEMNQFTSSVSGQFKTTLETFKIAFSEMGKPFLKVATFVLRQLLKIVNAFNSLPDGAKNFAAIAAIFTALIGPTIMLAGLFGNLIGNMGSGVAAVLNLIAKFNILNKSEWATQKVSELVREGFVKQSTAVELLTEQINTLTQAAAEARAAMGGLSGSSGVPLTLQSGRTFPNGKPVPLGVVPGNVPDNRTYGPKTLNDYLKSEMGVDPYSSKIADQQRVRAAIETLNIRSKEQAIAADISVLDRQAAEKRLAAEKAVNAAREKGKALVTGASAAVVSMGAATALMVQPWSEIGHQAGNLLLIGTFVVPAAKTLVTIMGQVAKAAKVAAAAAVVEAAAMNKAASSGQLLKAGAAGAFASFSEMMGPVGWTVAAIAAIGGGLYLWQKHQEKIYKEQVAAQKALNDSTEKWAASAGEVAKQFEHIKVAADSAFSGATSNLYDLIEQYKSSTHASELNAFKGLSGPEQHTAAMNKFVSMQVQLGLSAEEAAQHVQALYIAAGDSAQEADAKAKELYNQLGDISRGDWKIVLDTNAAQILATDPNSGMWKGRVQQFVEMWSQAFSEAANPKQAQKIMDQLNEVVMSGWQQTLDQMQHSVIDGQVGLDYLKGMGITTAEELRKYVMDSGNGSTIFGGMAADAYELEGTLANIIGSYNNLGDDLKSLSDLQEQWVIKTKQMPWADQQKAAYDLLKTYEDQKTIIATSTDEKEVQAAKEKAAQLEYMLRQVAINGNIKDATTFSGLLDNIMHSVRDETSDAADEAERLKKNIEKIHDKEIHVTINEDQAAGILKSGITGAVGDLADAASSTFDDKMNTAIDAYQAKWDNRINNMQKAHQKAMDALDSRWERRKDAVNKYYQARMDNIDKEIKAEQKAEELRQKMFQAEMDRLSRLADAQNRNIDFNVALNSGNFDEAAKIRNDAIAAADQNALQQAMDKGSGKSDKRVEHLNNVKDRLQKELDAEQKAMDKREAAEKKHLENLQKMQEEARKKEADAAIAAKKEEWDQEQALFQKKLDLLAALPIENKKQLDAALEASGLTIKDFGMGTSEEMGKFFQKSFNDHMRLAAAQAGQDNLWDGLGKDVALRMLRGMGFGSMRDFANFVKTGELPDNFGKNLNKNSSAPPAVSTGTNKFAGDPQFGGSTVTRHTGGWIDSSAGSRKGVARTNPMHSSERLVLAQDGEYMVDRGTATKFSPLLEAMSSGKVKVNRSAKNVGDGVGGYGYGLAGVVSAMIGVGLAHGVGMAMNNISNKKIAAMQAPSSYNGTYSAGKAGMYSDRSFGPEQLRNAAIIASIGSSMGMSKRDIEIGIMTAITESGLINVKYGDRDSLGLFQQRPSMGWGTPEQVTNPEYAARKFFSVLKGVANRGEMDPWLAAQAVQRSAYSDGSNYRQYWDNAQAIFNKGLTRKASGAYGPSIIAGPMAAGGTGGMHKPSVAGKGWSNSHDYRNGPGSPLYAYNDGVVVDSRAITSGGSPGNGVFTAPNGLPYRSYGETIAIRGKDGAVVRYAHLSPGKRFVSDGQQVRGGQLIGLSGWTGNATGPHTHFDVNGSYAAQQWFASHGIGLKKGGFIGRQGISNLHNAEVVVNKARTAKLWESMDAFNFAMGNMAKKLKNPNFAIPRDAVSNVANGGNSEYNVEVNLNGTEITVDEVTRAVFKAIKKAEDRKPGSRSN